MADLGLPLKTDQTWLVRCGFDHWENERGSGWNRTDEPVSSDCLGWRRARIWAVVDAPEIGRIVWWSRRTIYPDTTNLDREGPRTIARPEAVRRYLRRAKMILHTGVDPSRIPSESADAAAGGADA